MIRAIHSTHNIQTNSRLLLGNFLVSQKNVKKDENRI